MRLNNIVSCMAAKEFTYYALKPPLDKLLIVLKVFTELSRSPRREVPKLFWNDIKM